MKKLFIMRGVSGSGKSTYAKTIPNATIVSADDFFLTPEGKTDYNHEKIQEAHEYCFREFMEAIRRGDETVVVDNTNIQAWEISPYYLAGKAYGYEVEILNLMTDAETSASRTVHAVPKEHILRTYDSFKKVRLPSFWKVQNIG
jgi:predicted kinase